jgi:hypothetical protein
MEGKKCGGKKTFWGVGVMEPLMNAHRTLIERSQARNINK